MPNVTLLHRDKIALAKAHARGETSDNRPTSYSSLVVGTGEGRATRESELIWWLDLDTSVLNYGKLSFTYQKPLCSLCTHLSVNHKL